MKGVSYLKKYEICAFIRDYSHISVRDVSLECLYHDHLGFAQCFSVVDKNVVLWKHSLMTCTVKCFPFTVASDAVK